jgi:hypothetical protein
VVEHLPNKNEALNLNPSTGRKNQRGGEKERNREREKNYK